MDKSKKITKHREVDIYKLRERLFKRRVRFNVVVVAIENINKDLVNLSKSQEKMVGLQREFVKLVKRIVDVMEKERGL